MSSFGFKPSGRPTVKYVPDLEYAYVLQRYKETHDFIHVLTAKQITVD
jgi:ubiquinone biosynthesis protein COQ4